MSKTEKEKIEEFSKEAMAARRGTRADARLRAQGEQDMWHKWHKGGRKQQHLEPLLHSMKPMITRETNRRMKGLGGAVPRSALHNELQNAAVRQIESYDPAKAKLSTHVTNGFQRVTDFVASNRNASRMTRPKVEMYGEYSNARDEFMNTHGRDPSHHEMHTALPHIKKHVIKELGRGFRTEAFTGRGEGELENDPGSSYDQYGAAVQLMKGSLKPKELHFAEMHYPSQIGKKRMTVKQIAAAMKIPLHKAYDLRNNVDARIKPIIDVE